MKRQSIFWLSFFVTENIHNQFKATYSVEVISSEINKEDYIITYLIQNGEITKHRGCKIVDAVLAGINNPVQEYGSSLTYCRRYSLLMALGLATEDDDAASISQPMTKEDALNYVLPFGKHKGQKLMDIPQTYLQWMLSEDKYKKYHSIITLATGISIPSEEEQDKRIEMISLILKLCDEKGVDPEEVLEKFKVESLDKLTTEQMDKCYAALQKKEV